MDDFPHSVALPRSLRLKVKSECYAWLNAAAMEVNTGWNWAAQVSEKAARPCTGRPEWLSGFDLNNLSNGASKYFEKIGSETIQRVNGEYALKRKAAKRYRLRWRSSVGSHRSLGWVPIRADSIKREGRAVRFRGITIRLFESERLEGAKWGQGCFAQDALGDWWLCLPIKVRLKGGVAPQEKVGIDLGVKDIAVTSDAERCEKGRSAQLAKTRLAKSVFDAGWGMLKAQLQYKGQQAGRSVQIVSERNTSRTCSSCGSLCGPHGVNGLRVRRWTCCECGESHDRDVNAARNILRRAELAGVHRRERAVISGVSAAPASVAARATNKARKEDGMSTGRPERSV